MKKRKEFQKDIGRRSNCPIGCWLDLFGDKWTLLLVRDLVIFEKRTFKQFEGSEERIATNILTSRLKKLVKIGFVTKRRDPGLRSSFIYEPSPELYSMAPIFQHIFQWGSNHIQDTYSIQDILQMKAKLPELTL